MESTNVKNEISESNAQNDLAGAGGFKAKKKRGPPENGIPSTTKIMVANLPYELSEETVNSGSAKEI